MRYNIRRISRLRILAWLAVLIAVGVAAASIRIGATNQSVLRSEPRPTASPSSSNSRQLTINNNSYPNSPLNITTARPTPSKDTQRLTPLEAVPSTDYSYKNEEAESLRAEIEQAQQSLKTLKAQIDFLAEDMAPYKAQIDKYASVIKKLERDHDLGLSIDQDEYDRALRYHNYNVDLYNSKLAERGEKVAEYNQLLTQTKAKIARYNMMIKGTP
jgi:hypothetical protein